MIRTILETSCARAWSAACDSIIETYDEGYNVMIDVTDPVKHDAKDNAAITHVDRFLKRHEQNPIVTVANTIFPQDLYEAHRNPGVYDEYRKGFVRLSRETKDWGQYFDRMTSFQVAGGDTINPLQELVAKLKGSTRKATYELPIYHAATDRKRHRGGPCLSHLSFKRHPEEGLLLTAVYRNHYYISRLLGNLIGLGQLQAFVAKEAGGLEVGSLTIVSTHAEIDSGAGWGISEARALVREAGELLRD